MHEICVFTIENDCDRLKTVQKSRENEKQFFLRKAKGKVL